MRYRALSGAALAGLLLCGCDGGGKTEAVFHEESLLTPPEVFGTKRPHDASAG